MVGVLPHLALYLPMNTVRFGVYERAKAWVGWRPGGPPAAWGFSPETKFGLQEGRKPMAITFLVDRTYDTFLHTVVNAVQVRLRCAVVIAV